MSRLDPNSVSPVGALLKCLGALGALFIIAAGPWVFLSAGVPAGTRAGYASMQADQTVAESKRVFEERRQVYESARQNHSAAPKNAISSGWTAIQ
jgi:hypothetical protein